jgi:hypothetical protein
MAHWRRSTARGNTSSRQARCGISSRHGWSSPGPTSNSETPWRLPTRYAPTCCSICLKNPASWQRPARPRSGRSRNSWDEQAVPSRPPPATGGARLHCRAVAATVSLELLTGNRRTWAGLRSRCCSQQRHPRPRPRLRAPRAVDAGRTRMATGAQLVDGRPPPVHVRDALSHRGKHVGPLLRRPPRETGQGRRPVRRSGHRLARRTQPLQPAPRLGRLRDAPGKAARG